ncbi:cysteine dioxygenase [Owenweeksia hongkongensis]|uniref:cysteine dioxygenase n=1 Tax=Owenweeksia hongkongensis TaxID=253245 RepID=UPI003A916038
MEAIKTIERLKYNLTLGPGYEGYSAMIEAIDLSIEELDKVCTWRDKDYTRIRVYDTESVEALITCWPPESRSPIHDYELQQGWIKVLSGTLELEYFNMSDGKATLYGNRSISKGQYVYLNDGMGFHRFINSSRENAVALHLYCDKILKWNEFNEADGSINEVKVGCHIELDK